MGGASSKFEETNWDLADGELSKAEDTIDGAPPTLRYQIYHLNKRGVNQRAYDVVDEDSNLLYTTRAVEGTLAWFDVLGKGIDQFLLRVQVDLSRRYWVVYSYGVPTFSGQAADMEATERLGHHQSTDNFLYRKACITVTWSRFHAVVNMYRSKEGHDVDRSDTMQEIDIPVLSMGTQVAAPTSGICDEEESGDIVKDGERGSISPTGADTTERARYLNTTHTELDDTAGDRHDESSSNEMSLTVSQETLSDTYKKEDSILAEGSDEATQKAEKSSEWDVRKSMQRANAWTKWVSIKALETVEQVSSDPYSPDDTTEGVVFLDHPTLKCQEINSFTGQHQTMLILDDEIEELRQDEIRSEIDKHRPDQSTPEYKTVQRERDAVPTSAPISRISSWKNMFSVRSVANIEQHGRSSETNSETGRSDSGSIAGDPKPDADLGLCVSGDDDGTDTANDRNAEDSPFLDDGRLRGRPTNCAGAGASTVLDENCTNDTTAEQIGDYPTECKTSAGTIAIGRPGTSESSVTVSLADRDEDATATLVDHTQPSKQPLVGYWAWENTYRVHKMKLHVAKGSDLCLHVILAIVTNQLRYERNAVAATV